ncbi:MAG: ABC transporter permease subunit [Desulfobacteraceae bacterium]|jgi:microcin C transport system permease protein|nr:ABC transporter permease subunit [Desulfobacteraceae bacterium]
MERLDYFIKRLLLIIPTFIGITVLCFLIIQFVPGGPVEQAIMQMKGIGSGEISTGASSAQSITQRQRKQIEAYYGFDQPFYKRYWKWLVTDHIGMKMPSYRFPNKSAWQLIKERFKVSLIFGITGFLLSYLVCIPLGIVKALRHNSMFDVVSSIIVFVGYAIPAFAMGMVLKMILCGTVEGMWNIFPISGFHSDGFNTLSGMGKAKDVFMHMFLPVLCYVIGNFAVLTLLMKNSLIEQISKDYIRTVVAKGGSFTRAVWGHAFRNALIPIATGMGGILTVMFAGSVIIEQVFEIPGMGRLSLEAIVGRDYPVFMGILSLTSILGLLGNIFSDFLYVIIDPRINFQKS